MKPQPSPEELKQQAYQEALRYMKNAEELLEKAGKLDAEHFRDRKYIHIAAGTAYITVIKVFDKLFILYNIALIPQQQEMTPNGKKQKIRRPTINDYYRAVRELGEIIGDPALEEKLYTLYSLLHLYGYYDGVRDISVIRRGMNLVYEIIELLRPDNPLPAPPPQPNNPLLAALRQLSHTLFPLKLP